PSGAFSVSQDTVYSSRIQSFSLNGINFPEPIIMSTKTSHFGLGNKIIQYYYLTLNLKDDEIYLTPIPGKKFSQETNTFGFNFDYKNEQLIVGSIFQNGPA